MDDETESASEDGAGEPGRGDDEPAPSVERFRDRSFCAMRVSEKGRFVGARGMQNSETVLRIAVVISSREV